MKTSCEVIKDLLPLYHDGVCSIESKALVDEHLAVCESCVSELAAMEGSLPLDIAKHNFQEAQAVQKLAKKWRSGMWKSVLKGALFAVLAISILVLILYAIVDVKVVF